jgi:phosphomannomutase
MAGEKKKPIVSVSGVRGIVGAGLYPEDVALWGAAFATLCGGGKVLVGRDTRSSGPMMQAALTAGLLSAGADAVDLGVCPTPTVQVAVPLMKAAGGVIVTASHNPEEWNALKFVAPSGCFLDRSGLAALIGIVEGPSVKRVGAGSIGLMRDEPGAVDLHIEGIHKMEMLDVRAIRSARFKVAVDACNGAGSDAVPELLSSLGCEVLRVNCDPAASFPRGTEPTRENLGEFEREVKSGGADVGFALDPDADRLSLVTGEGLAPGEEYTLPLAVDYVLGRTPGPVCANLSTSAMIDSVARRHGCKVYRSPVGEANVVSMMIEKGCVAGGEGNGGVIIPALHHGRDSLVGIAAVLALMATTGSTVSSLCGKLPEYSMLKTKIRWDGGGIEDLAERLRSRWSSAEFDLTDGVKVIWSDRWVHVRPSGTEPVVRVIAEAPDPGSAEALVSEARSFVTGRNG